MRQTIHLARPALLALVLPLFLVGAGAAQQQQQQPSAQQPQTAPQPSKPAPATPAAPSPSSPSAPGAATPSAGATPAAPPITTTVKLVTLYATVRDKKGKLVSNLDKSNFTVEEDGRPQTIQYFARDPDVPLLLGLLVDTSLSQRHVIGAERTASSAFIDHMLRADKDKAFLIHFDREVELLEDLTNSRDKLRAALNDLQTADRDDSGGGSGGRGGSGGGGRGGYGSHRGGTQLYDAIYLAANEIMKKQQGRKAVVVLSDGVDRGSKVSLPEAVEAAQRADTLVYSILFTDPDAPRPGSYSSSNGSPGGWGGGRRGGQGRYPQQEQRPDGKKILERISKETGGRLFQVNKKDSVDDIYTELEQELRTQYSLAYTPDKSTGTTYHMLKVTTNQKDDTVQSRDGYYSEK
jgi:VWFA-related protein